MVSLLLTISIYPQTPNDTTGVAVASIRRMGKSTAAKNDSLIEITLTRLGSFYVGDAYYCLQIGKLRLAPGNVGGIANNRLVFAISKDNWRRLKNGDALWLTWGCRQPSAYESMKPFAYLNKKTLAKK